MSTQAQPSASAGSVDLAPPTPWRARLGKLLRGTLSVAFLTAAGIGLFTALSGHGAEILDLLTRPGAQWYLAAALLCSVAGLVFLMDSWHSVLASLGSPLTRRSAGRIYFVALLGNYIPGPFMAAAASVHLGHRAGVPPRRMVTGYLVSVTILLVTSAPVALLVAPRLLGATAAWLTPLLLLGVFLVWRPQVVFVLADRTARLLRRPPVVSAATPGALRRAVLMAILSWVVGGTHLWFIALVLGAPAAVSLPLCVGAFALATSAGLLVLVLPDGAGVRELVMMGTLTTMLPLSQSGAAALASRVSSIAAQLIAAGAVVLLDRIRPRS